MSVVLLYHIPPALRADLIHIQKIFHLPITVTIGFGCSISRNFKIGIVFFVQTYHFGKFCALMLEHYDKPKESILNCCDDSGLDL